MLTCNNKRCKHYSQNLQMIPSENWRKCCNASVAKSMPARLYHIGDSVKVKPFTDCFKVSHPASPVLTVREERTIINSCPHYRIVATAESGEYWESAESHFEGA